MPWTTTTAGGESGRDSATLKPYLGRNDLELLFDYVLERRLALREHWCRAVADGNAEQFLATLCRKLAHEGCAVCIVKTREDGTRRIADLSGGFVTTVFDVDI